MKAKLLGLLKAYNDRTGYNLNLGDLAILMYGERPISEASMKVAFSRLINGHMKFLNYGDIERLASILQLSTAEIFEIFGKNNLQS
jgi:hypothetical protein